MQARCNDLGDMWSDVHGLGPAHSTPPVAVPSTQNRQNVVGHFGPAAVLRDSAGVMTGTQNATSGTKETAQHPRDNMGSIMHFDGLEMGSKSTIPF